MKQQSFSFLRAVIATTMVVGAGSPAVAAPISLPEAPAAPSQIIHVQQESSRMRIIGRPDFPRPGYREFRRDRDNRFERRGNAVYWRGHRGWRDRRPGYREHNGWWFPPAAFALGAIVGGALNQPVPRYGNAHVEWCYDRYRSYRASDNTFQPYNGPRRPCISPYS